MIRLAFTLLTLLAVALSAEAKEGVSTDSADLAQEISLWIAPLDEAKQVSGTLLVARAGIVLIERSYGMADYELQVPNEPSTRFNIASVTKNLTQIALLSLMTEEQLEEPISSWLPEFPAADRITAMQLAEHKAGIPHRVTEGADEARSQSAETMTALASKADLLFEPGGDRSYSSAGYSVLARVLELAAGESYEHLLRRFVTAPVGAVHAAHPSPVGLIDRRADGYFHGGDALPSPPRNLSFLVGAGSVYATARDLFLIQRGLIEGAYGERVRAQLMGEKGLRWNGNSNGYRAFADYYADGDLTVVFVGNMFTGAADLIRASIPRIVQGEEVGLPKVPDVSPVAVSEASQSRLEGSYRLGSTVQRLEFRTATLAFLGDWVLLPTGNDRFFSPQDYAEVTVVSGRDGIEALQWGAGPSFPRVGREH